MRGATIVEVRKRLRRVVDHIDAQAEFMPSVTSLAAIAELSPFHFIRFYRKHVGETPGETALRLRLARARTRLASGESVTRVAAFSGYGSVQAFSHAFQRMYRLTPSRVPRGVGLPCVPPRLEWLSDRLATGIRFHGRVDDAAMAFDRAVAGCKTAGLEVQCTDVYAIVYGDLFARPNDLIRIDAVVANPGVWPRGLDRITIPGGLHVVLRSLGPLVMAEPLIARLANESLPQRGLGVAPGPVICRPLRDPAVTPPSERLWDIYLPMQRAISAIAAE